MFGELHKYLHAISYHLPGLQDVLGTTTRGSTCGPFFNFSRLRHPRPTFDSTRELECICHVCACLVLRLEAVLSKTAKVTSSQSGHRSNVSRSHTNFSDWYESVFGIGRRYVYSRQVWDFLAPSNRAICSHVISHL